jgi:hypothetical protein
MDGMNLVMKIQRMELTDLMLCRAIGALMENTLSGRPIFGLEKEIYVLFRCHVIGNLRYQ